MESESIETMQDLTKLFTAYDPRVWIGILAGITVFIIEIILCSKGIIFSGVEKKIKKAKEEGNVIVARRISSHWSGPLHERYYTAKYEYTYRGKKRHKTLGMHGFEWPLTIAVYYTNKSRKPVTEYDMSGKYFRIFLYIIPVLVCTGVMLLLGYQP